ncbi:hypothetical protein SLS60_001960 [Paraconiothyrium brasiliense]|uniref:Extracellular membrane protein CFEM domain-containing protein n=1 Tax=Paraconiothyrium brasiliense TaxID=300254 RepID=A0ABR3S0U1_9PLEO
MSTILSTLTLSSTIFATLSTAIPSSPPDIPSAIRGLSDCSQDVLFPLLGTSQCNPADFPCICVELDHLGARKEVSDKCPEHVDEYNDFAVNTCGNHAGVVTVTGSSSSESPVSITTISVIISTGGPENVTSSAPFNNGTAVAPTKTESVVLPSETSQSNGTSGGSGGSNSGPSGSGSAGAGQGSGSSPTQPENPEFSGAAVSEFGNGNLATFAGFMGMMWLAFAEL